MPDLRGRQVVHRGKGPGSAIPARGAGGPGDRDADQPTRCPPTRTASARADGVGTSNSPVGQYWAAGSGAVRPYHSSADVWLAGDALGTTGGSQGHENMPPFLTLNFVIALYRHLPEPELRGRNA